MWTLVSCTLAIAVTITFGAPAVCGLPAYARPIDSVDLGSDTLDSLPNWNWAPVHILVGRDIEYSRRDESRQARKGSRTTGDRRDLAWDTLPDDRALLRGVQLDVLAWRTLIWKIGDSVVILREALIAARWRNPNGGTRWMILLSDAQRDSAADGGYRWVAPYPHVFVAPPLIVREKGGPLPRRARPTYRVGRQVRDRQYFSRRPAEADILAFIADVDSVRAKYRDWIPAFWTGVPQPRADYTLWFADGDVRENAWKQVTGSFPRARFPNGR